MAQLSHPFKAEFTDGSVRYLVASPADFVRFEVGEKIQLDQLGSAANLTRLAWRVCQRAGVVGDNVDFDGFVDRLADLEFPDPDEPQKDEEFRSLAAGGPAGPGEQEASASGEDEAGSPPA